MAYLVSDPFYCGNCAYWDGERKPQGGNSFQAIVRDRSGGICTNGSCPMRGKIRDPLSSCGCKSMGYFVRWYALNNHPLD